MKPILPLLGLAAATALPCAGQLVINEVMQNPSAVGDGSGEWFEIYNPTGGPIDINGWTVSDNGADSFLIDNGGPLEVPAGGYLVLGNSADTLANGGVNVDYEYTGMFLSNGDDELILTDASSTEIDRIEWDGGPNWPDPNGSSMALLDATSDNNIGSNWFADETNIYGDGDTGTPGAANPVAGGPLMVALDIDTLSEGSFDIITGTVTLPAAATSDIEVTVSIDDGSEAQAVNAFVFSGDSSGEFVINAVDDLWEDGDQTVTVTVSAPTYDDASTTFTITDDDLGSLVIINEVYNVVEGIESDANADGVADTGDEFVEIINVSGGPLDLSGFTLSDSSFDRHFFPFGTVLEDGCALLVFGGGDIVEGSTAAFGNTPVQLALSNPDFPGLFLDDDGDTLRLVDLAGVELHAVTLPDQSGDVAASSITSTTDADPTSGFVLHTSVSAAPYSPGTAPDGTPYCPLTDALTVAISGGPYTEEDGLVTGVGTVTIPAALGANLDVFLASSDTGELDFSFISPVTILAGETSANFDLQLIDDVIVDGTQTVTVTASAMGYLNGDTTLDVEDGNDTPVFTDLVINEFDTDQPGTDAAEFVELYNNTGDSQSLTGLVVVLINGNGDSIYASYDLSGFTIDANGFFVLGNVGVPNAQIELPSNGLQNGADAIAIYAGSISDYGSGTSVVGLPGTLVDAVVYDGTDAELQAALDPTGSSIPELGVADSAAARATDGGAPFSSASFVSQTPTPGASNGIMSGGSFSDWATANGIPGEPFDGDFDMDGIPNGVEYAIDGLDPDGADSLADAFDGSTLSFTKRAEAVANGDVIYSIEESDDLGATDVWEEVLSYDANDATTISYTLPGGAGTLFARLRVEQLGVAF